MKLRKIAATLMAAGLVVGMLGSGVGASFTDSVTAVQTIKVGSFGCSISSTQGNVVGKTLTYNAPDIMSSVAGNSPFSFTIASTGNIPVLVHLTQTTPAAPFSNLLAPQADVTLTNGQSKTYAAGIGWTTLGMLDLGKTVSVTYTAACGEVPAGQTPIDPQYTTPRPSQIGGVVQYYSIFQCDYAGSPLALTRIEAPTNKTNAAPGAWYQFPAGDPVGRAYVLAYNDGQAPPPLSACPQFVTVHFWKTVDNTFGGAAVAADFTLDLAQNFSSVATGHNGDVVQVLPGAYTLSEIDPTGTYGGIQGGCYKDLSTMPAAGQGMSLDVTMAGGETWYCGFVNRLPSNLFFYKTVDNTAGGTAVPGDFTIHLDNVGHSYSGNGDGTESGVVAGTYTLTETGPTTNYTSDGGNCTNLNTGDVQSGPTVAITANPGDSWLCSFTNTYAQ